MRRALLPLALALLAPLGAATGPVDGRVRLNSVGFTPGAPKEATVAAAATKYRVIRVSDDAVVLEGDLGASFRTAVGDTDEAVQRADFSALTAPGEYQLDIPGVGRSAPFTVSATLWTEPFKLVTRAMYLWRCGTAVHGTWQGQTYQQTACHLDDAWLTYVGGGAVKADGTGGWHDAGDYNKYVVNAGVSVGMLFKAWEHFRPRIGDASFDIPESTNAVPDFLDEIRWELEWLLKMQLPDGRVYHKVSAQNFNYWGPAGNDRSARYFVPWSTTATADFAAMMALGARHFREFDAAFADRCLAAARLAWSALEANPSNVAANQQGFSTGEYAANDPVHRLWAAAELWVTTREAKFLQEFETRAANQWFSPNGPTWGDVRDLGLGTYLDTNSDARSATLVTRLRNNLIDQANTIVRTTQEHGYGRGMGGGNWWWGANGSVAGQTYLLHLADRLQPDSKYRAAAERTLGFLFGRNYHNRSYVTGLGHQPPLHPHDRRGGAWPGYLVGGGHPTGRSWKDDQDDYAQNEIAINWNTALAYALAALVEPTSTTPPRYDWATFPRGTRTTFQPVFTETGPLAFSAVDLPAWATLDAATGAISGTPTDNPITPVDEATTHQTVRLTATRDGVAVATRMIVVTTANPGSGAQVLNLSTRGAVNRGGNPMIAGFVNSPGPARPMILRAVGPTLADYGLGGVLVDPTLTLKNGQQVTVAENNDWTTLPDGAALMNRMQALGAFALRNGSKDAVLFERVGGGTALAEAADGSAGIALVEIYDENPDDRSSEMLNLSTRGYVGTGAEVMIAGVVVRGGGAARLLIRAAGPTLAGYGVGGALSDPVLTVFSGQTELATNDNWGAAGDTETLKAAFDRTLAFPFATGTKDAALIVDLPAGSFTIKVEGKNGATGVALVEVYVVKE